MPRLVDTVLEDGTAYAGGSATLDLSFGGQFGHAPAHDQWVSNQQDVPNNIVLALVEPPRMYKEIIPNGDKWIAALKAFFELHPKNVTGFNSHLTVNVATAPVGGAGEQHHDVVNVVREPSVLVITGMDKSGRPVYNLLDHWVRYGLMSPDTKYPLASSMDPNVTDWLPDMYSATILAYEPDNNFRRVRDAWLTTNVYPLSTPTRSGQRDLTADLVTAEYSITFSGTTTTGPGVRAMAQRWLDKANGLSLNPYNQNSFITEEDPTVAKSTTGYVPGIQGLDGNQIT